MAKESGLGVELSWALGELEPLGSQALWEAGPLGGRVLARLSLRERVGAIGRQIHEKGGEGCRRCLARLLG